MDNLFLLLVTWLFAAVVTLYFVREIYLVIVVATSVALGVCFLANLRHKKTLQKEKEAYGASLCAQHFMFHDDTYALDYFYNALRSRYTANKSRFFLTINKTMVAPCVTEPLTLKKAVLFYSEALRKSADTLVILSFKSEKFPVDLKTKFTGLRFELFGADKTYRLLKSLDRLPAEEKPIKTRKLREFLTAAFLPKRAKGYLGVAFIMLFGAYFSISSIYYVAAAAVCLALALLCKLDVAERVKRGGIGDQGSGVSVG